MRLECARAAGPAAPAAERRGRGGRLGRAGPRAAGRRPRHGAKCQHREARDLPALDAADLRLRTPSRRADLRLAEPAAIRARRSSRPSRWRSQVAWRVASWSWLVRFTAMGGMRAAGRLTGGYRAYDSDVDATAAEALLRLAEEASPRLREADAKAALDELEGSHDDLLAAVAWFLDQGRIDEALRWPMRSIGTGSPSSSSPKVPNGSTVSSIQPGAIRASGDRPTTLRRLHALLDGRGRSRGGALRSRPRDRS